MKKLEIYKMDETTLEEIVITLLDKYGFISEETAHMLNEATDDMFVCVVFGGSSVMLKKKDIRYMVISEVSNGE